MLSLHLTKYGWVEVQLHAFLALHSEGMSPRYRSDGRVGQRQDRSGSCGEEKNHIISHAGDWTPVVHPVAQALHWLSYSDSTKF
jgi:hypothetical protein